MEVLVLFDNFQGNLQEFTYFSNYSRINAKGIKQEAKNKMIQKYGSHVKDYKIIKLCRN